jgi:hypothetical protein
MALTRINNQALTNITSAGLPSGTVLQVQSYAPSSTTNITTTSYTDINSRSFTPKSASSSLLIWVTFRWQESSSIDNVKARIQHDGTTIFELSRYLVYTGDANIIGTNTFHGYVASTGSTNARTIAFQAALYNTGTLSIDPNSGGTGQASRMTIVEIAG